MAGLLPEPAPRAVPRFGTWEGMHATGLTWEQLHLTGLTWEGLIWLPEPAPEHVSPTRVGLNGARSGAVGLEPPVPSVALGGSRRSLARPAVTATSVALGGSRRSLAQTGPPGGRQHGRPGP